MVILLKSWRGNIVVKLFTTFVSEYFKIFLRNSWEQFQGNSQELVLKACQLQIFSGFSDELVTRNSLENWLQEIPWIEIREFPRAWFLGMGYEKFLGKTVDVLTGFSSERFLGISADFPQNCYLGRSYYRSQSRISNVAKI